MTRARMQTERDRGLAGAGAWESHPHARAFCSDGGSAASRRLRRQGPEVALTPDDPGPCPQSRGWLFLLTQGKTKAPCTWRHQLP